MPNAFAPLLEESKIHRRKERKEKSTLQQKSRTKREEKRHKRRGSVVPEAASQPDPPVAPAADEFSVPSQPEPAPPNLPAEPPCLIGSTTKRWADIRDDDDDEDELDLDIDHQLPVLKYAGSTAASRLKKGKTDEEDDDDDDEEEDDDDEEEDDDDDDEEEENEEEDEENDDNDSDRPKVAVGTSTKLKSKRVGDSKAIKLAHKSARHRLTETLGETSESRLRGHASRRSLDTTTKGTTSRGPIDPLTQRSGSINEDDSLETGSAKQPALSRQEQRNLELQELTSLIHSVGLCVPEEEVHAGSGGPASSKSRRRKRGGAATGMGVGSGADVASSPKAETVGTGATDGPSEQQLQDRKVDVPPAASDAAAPTTTLSSEEILSNARKAAAAKAKKKVGVSAAATPVVGLSQSVTAALLQEAKKKATVKKSKQRRDKQSFDY